MSRIYYTKPSITDLEIRYAADAAAHGWGDRRNEYIDRFEMLFCEHLGVKHAIATSSGTGALHMGLAALGIAAGDEVILADINWIASAAPITYLGAKPVLVDVKRDTWCIDPEAAEAAITPRTKAIVAVHLYGNLCDMDALLAVGRQRGIPIVEDAAEAVGSIWHGKRAGSMGAFGAFSFHGTKTITTGEGGMFVTNDAALYEKVMTLSNHGRAKSQSRQFWPDTVGFKYKMSNVQAAIGCGQMERIDALIARKREIFEGYRGRLAAIADRVTMNAEPPGTLNGYWMPTIVAKREVNFDREKLLEEFARREIDGRVFFWPLSLLGLPQLAPARETTVARSLYEGGVNLPSYHDMTDTDLDRVSAAIGTAIP